MLAGLVGDTLRCCSAAMRSLRLTGGTGGLVVALKCRSKSVAAAGKTVASESLHYYREETNVRKREMTATAGDQRLRRSAHRAAQAELALEVVESGGSNEKLKSS